MASIFKRAKNKDRPGSKWYITYAAAPGVYKTVAGLTDRRLTEQLAGKLESDALLRHRGVIDPVAERWAEHGKAPIDGHVTAYETYLESKRNTEQHVRETKALIEDSIAECKWGTITDIDGARFSDLLKRDVAGGLAPRTANKRRLAVRGFTRWLAREARLRADSLAGRGCHP